MTLLEMRTVVKRLLHNRTELTDANYNEAINDAYKRFAVGRISDGERTNRIYTARWPQMEFDVPETLVDSQSAYDYPTNAMAIDAVYFRYDTTNNRYRKLNEISYDRFIELDVTDDEEPQMWAVHNDMLYVTPTPGSDEAGANLRILGYYGPGAVADLSADGDTPTRVPENFHRAISYMAARDLLREHGEEERAEEVGNHALRLIAETQNERHAKSTPNRVGNRPLTPRSIGRLRRG